MPCYDVLAGGVSYQGKAKLAGKIGTVPAKKIPEMLAQAFAAGAVDEKGLKKIVKRFDDFSSADFCEDLYSDFDSGEPVRNVPESFAEQGREVTAVEKAEEHFVVKVKRKR